jgi:hypothetical protein
MPYTYSIRIAHRLQTHWDGGYSKADFDRLVTPLLEQHNAFLKWKHGPVSRYEVTFDRPQDAALFRQKLTERVRFLHSKASYGWEFKSHPD